MSQNVTEQPPTGSRTVPEPTLGDLVKTATTDLSGLIRMEIELAKTEVKFEAKKAVIGAAAFGVAGFLGLLFVLFLSVFFAEGLHALGLYRWLGYLIVAGGYLVLAGLIAAFGYSRVRKVGAPERTIETVKDDIAWAKHPTTAPDRKLDPARTPELSS